MALLHAFTGLIALSENGRLPDALVRMGIRSLLKSRLRELEKNSLEQTVEQFQQFLAEISAGPIACVPEKANEQHYEVPAEFFANVLGSHRKYSCCYWTSETRHCNKPNPKLCVERANMQSFRMGQTILELGCGWGSLSLCGWLPIILVPEFWPFPIPLRSVSILKLKRNGWG